MTGVFHREADSGRCEWCHDPWPCLVTRIRRDEEEKGRPWAEGLTGRPYGPKWHDG